MFPESIKENQFYNITQLVVASNFKKIMVCRNSWGGRSYAIVNKIRFDKNRNPQYACISAIGRIKYMNGTTFYGSLPCVGTYAWRLIKVLDEDLEVEFIEKVVL